MLRDHRGQRQALLGLIKGSSHVRAPWCSAPWSGRWLAAAAWVCAWAVAAAPGCTASPAPACRADGDCASGRCDATGRCADYVTPSGDVSFGDSGQRGGHDAAAGDAALDSGRVPADAGVGDAADAAGTRGGWTCAPNHDGRVDRSEVVFAPGLSAPFAIAIDAKLDSAGVTGTDGTRVWDFSGPLPSDETVQVQTVDPATAWFAKDFAGATYAVRLEAALPLLGVFEATGDALLLRGVVSEKDGLLRTRLVYDPPAQVLKFPIEGGASWTSSSTVTGEKDGIYALWLETWASVSDAKGVAKTPYGNFPVQRVRTTLTRKIGLLSYVTRSLAWTAECFGTVASARSALDEPAVEFSAAAELRRLTLPAR